MIETEVQTQKNRLFETNVGNISSLKMAAKEENSSGYANSVRPIILQIPVLLNLKIILLAKEHE